MDNSSPESLLDQLIEASTFGPDDLQQNREGRMSGLQRFRLALMTLFYFTVSALLFTLAIGAFLMFFEHPESVPCLFVVGWAIICGYGGSYWLRHALPMWSDVRTNKVLCVTGPMHRFYTRTGGRAPVWAIHYRIAKKFFDVAFFAPKLFPQDQVCHGYYAQQSAILVGIEPI